MRTVSRSSHDLKNLGPKYIHEPLRVKIWLKTVEKKVVLTKKLKNQFFFFIFSNSAHDDDFGELSWAKKTLKKLMIWSFAQNDLF